MTKKKLLQMTSRYKYLIFLVTNRERLGLAIFLLFFYNASHSQKYKDYIGAGHNIGVTITASSQSHGTSATKTMDGSGMNAKVLDASRFLGQATFGVHEALIDSVATIGYHAWIDQQFAKQPENILPKLNQIWSEIFALDTSAFGPYSVHFNYAWWQTNMTNQDLLRQRVAYALSQILVTSVNSDLGSWGESVASYYDIFINHAFGNYKDILLAVTKHPAMGYYLSHLNNYPEDVANNIHPDENFAREIMQLFTIGLYQLHQDGSRITDHLGHPIPTYNNNDIKQLARVFTGLGGSVVLNMMYCPTVPEFGTDIYCLDKTSPMKMFAWAHQTGSKSFLGHTIPGSSNYTDATAMAEIDNAVTFLFNHPNTAPFVSYRLIQRLVKSNPSSAYIGRVAAIFANNGNGIRGDMKAIIKAILLDQEASHTSADSVSHASKLREPFIRYTHISRALPTTSDKGRYWNNGINYLNDTKQHVMASPSVFNFYLPDYQPTGAIAEQNLVAPEFKLHNTATSVGYINAVHAWSLWNSLMYSWEGSEANPDGVQLLTTHLQTISDDTEILINRLDKLFTHGQLTDQTRQIMRNALNPLYWTWDNDWRYWRTRLALYLIMISPDYNCVK